MSVTADVTELRGLAADLGKVPEKVQRGIRPIVLKGAYELRRKMRDDMRESNYFKGNAQNMSFDIEVDGSGVEAQVGPKPSWLAHIAYFGGANGGGGTVDILGPLGEEIEPFENALSDLLKDVI